MNKIKVIIIVIVALIVVWVAFLVLAPKSYPGPVEPVETIEESSKDDGDKETFSIKPIFIEKYSNTDTEQVDRTGWLMYKNKELGFEFLYPPEDTVVVDGYNISLESDTYRHWIPIVWVKENTKKLSTLESLYDVVYYYSTRVRTLEIDGAPAFMECTGEGGGCSFYITTTNFVYRIGSFFVDTIKINEDVAGARDKNVEWPAQLERPSLPQN